MVNPLDAAPDILQPQFDQVPATAPDDAESTGLITEGQGIDPPVASEKDDSALSRPPLVHPDGDTRGPVEASQGHHASVSPDLNMQPIRRQQPEGETAELGVHEPADNAAHETANAVEDDADSRVDGAARETEVTDRAASYRLEVQRVGASAVSAAAQIVEAPRLSAEEQPDVDDTPDARDAVEEATTSTWDPEASGRDQESESDSSQPPQPPDDPGPPIGGPSDEEEPEDQDGGHDGRVEEVEKTRKPREAAEAPKAGGEDGRIAEGVYSIDRAARLFGISYDGVRDVLKRTDSLLNFQNTPEASRNRVTNLPAPYMNALRDFQQQNGIGQFKRAADRFANTLEGQSLAHGLRAEHEDRLREFEKAQNGFLTPAQAADLMNVSPAYLIQHGLVTDLPPADEQTGRIENFVRPQGVSVETVRQTMEWTHTAFDDPMPVPEAVYYPSSEAEKVLGCGRRAVVQMATHGYIPNWRFEAESGASNRRYPQEYVDALGEHIRTHNKMDLIDAADQFAHEHPDAHTLLRGQFELGLHRLAKDGDGYIPREQLAGYFHLPQGQFWRTFGPKPDDRGYPLSYVRERIAWSGAEIADRERVAVDARGRTRWEVSSPGIKEQILGEVAAGSLPTDAANIHGIPPRTVLGWVEAGRQRDAPGTAEAQARESQRVQRAAEAKEKLARAFESRVEQQEIEVSEAGKGMSAEVARQTIVDSRPVATRFVKWVVENEPSLMHVAGSREENVQRQIASQIQVARLLSEQHRIYPADMLTFAKIFEDLRPIVQATPMKPGENPEDRPVMSAHQLAALRRTNDLARQGKHVYFPETGA
ncbi:MAG: hypothetical protein ACHQT5_01170 [Candidatus Saccharimonadales bacterium]